MRSARFLALIAILALAGCTERESRTMSFETDTQQEIQDTVVAQLRATLTALPPGTVIDAGRFAGAGHNSPCDDTGSGPTTPMRFHTVGELRLPGAVAVKDAVTAVGEMWRGWGWAVVEREGFGTPNRFGHSPDGYRLQIVVTAAGHPPTVQASSPCFPRPVARDDVPFPRIITAG